MDLTHGTWGERLRTFRSGNCLVTLLWLKPHKRCSWHKHQHQYNQFTVISGKLGIKTNIGSIEEPGQRQITWIGPRQSFIVKPGVTHEFRTGALGAVIEEVAYTVFDESDIQRELLGGNLKGEE